MTVAICQGFLYSLPKKILGRGGGLGWGEHLIQAQIVLICI